MRLRSWDELYLCIKYLNSCSTEKPKTCMMRVKYFMTSAVAIMREKDSGGLWRPRVIVVVNSDYNKNCQFFCYFEMSWKFYEDWRKQNVPDNLLSVLKAINSNNTFEIVSDDIYWTCTSLSATEKWHSCSK